MLGVPRIFRKLRSGQLRDQLFASPADIGHVEAVVRWRVLLQVCSGKGKQPSGRPETTAMFMMPGLLLLQLEMDEAARELDQPFIESVVVAGALEPEMLEDIVRLVILPGVK